MKNSRELVKKAAQVIAAGGLVIFPTDTAMGLGCRVDDNQALLRLNKLTGRPDNRPLPVLVESLNQAQKYLKPLSERARDLARRYWPGALTIVYWCRLSRVLPLVRGKGKTLGVRQPNHPVPLGLIDRLNLPIIGTSANFHHGPTPYSSDELNPGLTAKVDLVIPGRCPLRLHSTVIDLTRKPWHVLRQGAVTLPKSQLANPRR